MSIRQMFPRDGEGTQELGSELSRPGPLGSLLGLRRPVTPVSAALERERREALRAALARLSPEDRELLDLLMMARAAPNPACEAVQVALVEGEDPTRYRAHLAVDQETNEPVAVKFVRLGSGKDSALEVANARKVHHPYVCRVYHTGRHGTVRFIVMETLVYMAPERTRRSSSGTPRRPAEAGGAASRR